MELLELPREIQELVRSEIRSDEKVIWIDQPDPKRMMLSGIPQTLFGIPWTAFSIFWIYGASGFGQHKMSGPMFLIPLFGTPFVLVGLYMLSAPYWKRLYAQKTAYVLTNKRAICLNKNWKGYESSTYNTEKLQSMKKVVRENGTGDIIFEEIHRRNPEPGAFASKKIGFLAISNVNDVENLIRASYK